MVAAVVLVTMLLMVALLIAQGRPAADEPYVDGPLGPALIMPPDPSKPIDVNTPTVEPTNAP